MKTMMARLRRNLEEYVQWRSEVPTLDKKQFARALEDGRVFSGIALAYLCEAERAFDRDEQAKAMELFTHAQDFWARALDMQIPAGKRDRLLKQPDQGGRPVEEKLQRRLAQLSEAEDGTDIARAREAIRKDEILREKYGAVGDYGVRKALRAGISKLNRN